jgi:flagellar motility protein MotE (MotC chaperone)
MKTSYDQHFKKMKQTNQVASASLNLNQIKSRPSNVSRNKKSKTPFPMKPLIGFIIVAGSGLLFLDNFDSFEKFAKKIEFSIGTAYAEELKTSAAKDAVSESGAVATDAGVDQKAVAVEGKKIEDSDYLFKLADRKKQLDEREAELNKIAEQIQKQKEEINKKLTELEEVRQKISNQLQDRIKQDDGKIEVLVQMYTNMKPQQAAKIFETLDEDLVIEILSRMKKKNAADILNLVKAEKAQVLAERYTGYRAPASTEQK